MARPRNPAHRAALMSAATVVFATQGLGASTASIAKAAGVSTGTLFVYFDSKTALVNELYVALKTEMGEVATRELPASAQADKAELRDRLHHMWDRWGEWALDAPEKRRALAVLSVAEDLTDESRAAVHAAYADIADTLRQIMAGGPLEHASLGFVTTLLSAIADATLDDLIARPPTSADDDRIDLAFDALWRALAGAENTSKEYAL